jgi:hypothetical protein
LKQVLLALETEWTVTTVPDWYGQGQREIEITSDTAVWYHGGKPPVSIRWMLIRDPKGRFRSQALLCTDVKATSLQIVKWFVFRWQVEVTFQEARAHLG